LWYKTLMTEMAGQALLVLILCLACTSCGYHRQESTVQLPEWVRTIYIAPLKNNSNELRLGTWITDELREEFLRDSGLKLVPREEADVILEGRVLSAYTTGLSYVRYDVAVERRIGVECSVTLTEARTGKEIWQSATIYREEGFYVAKDIMTTEDHKDTALKKISQDIAEIVHHRISGVF